MYSNANGFSFLKKILPCQTKASIVKCTPQISTDSMFNLNIYTRKSTTRPLQEDIFPYVPRMLQRMMVIYGFKLTTLATNCLIQMYIKCSRLECAGKVFDRMSERDRVSWNAMIFGYSISGKMDPARSFFDSMLKRDVISWNSLISGYLQNGNCLESVQIFVLMGRDGAVVAYDETTFSVVLKAYSDEEDYSVGRQIHRVMVKLGF